MSRQPAIHFSPIPRLMLDQPGMAGGRNFLGIGRSGVQMERKEITVGMFSVGLIKDGSPVRELQGVRIIKTTHSRHCAKIVVERAVLLHEQNDMLDVLQTTSIGRLCQNSPYVWRQER